MKKRLPLITCFTTALLGTLLLGVLLAFTGWWMILRPQPRSVTKELFEGVSYQRISRSEPRSLVIHVVRVDLRAAGIGVFVTPGDPKAELPLKARTTARFLEEYNVQVAINGDAFTPWFSRTILNYYPHSGDPVDVIGPAIADGVVYSTATDNEPALYFGNNNSARLDPPGGKARQAIAGRPVLVAQGKSMGNLGDSPEPRTAAGLNRRRNELILVVVDGRQPGYSEGMTLDELAELMVSLGAFEALNLDGGGSSTLVIEGKNGEPMVLNSPINHNIPGLQRAVGNHLGIFAIPADNTAAD